MTATVVALTVLGVATPSSAAPNAAARPQVLVVSPRGSDHASGTAAHPLRSVQLAVDRVARGGRVELRGGTYHQRIRLVGSHGLVLAPYRHERAAISGHGLTPPKGLTGLIEIRDSTAVTVRGLDLSGYRTARRNVVPAGIVIRGHDRSIRIVGNHVHDLGNDNNTLGSFDINAHGIAAYGDDPHSAIRDLAIRGNVVDNLHLGASETVVVNGNVDRWSIVGNRIRDNDNIGIDAIGYESTLTGRYRYTQRNRARNGLIAGNDVARIRSRGNPAYWDDGEWCNCADAIYVDGGAHIRIRGNRVSDSDIGIEVAAENGRGQADHVRVSSNRIIGSLYTGLTTGGYCNGAEACGDVQTGSSHDNTFDHNMLRGNNRLDDGSPELLIQYHSYRDTFRNNTIVATNDGHVVYGTVPRSDSRRDRSDGNTFRVVGAPRSAAEFGWQGRIYLGLRAFRSATGQDRHSHFG